MKITELNICDKFLIENADSNTSEVIADVNRRYPADINLPWHKGIGMMVDQVLVVRNGVHITVPVDTEVKQWYYERGQETTR